MKNYEERMKSIQKKAKHMKAVRFAVRSTATMLVIVVLIVCGTLFGPRLLNQVRSMFTPTGGFLNQPSGTPSTPGQTELSQPTSSTEPTQASTGPIVPPVCPLILSFQATEVKTNPIPNMVIDPVIINSIEELRAFCDRYAELGNEHENVRSQVAKYDGVFFEKHSLIILTKFSNDLVHLRVDGVSTLLNDVYIGVTRLLPMAGENIGEHCFSYLFVEVDRKLPENVQVTLEMRDKVDDTGIPDIVEKQIGFESYNVDMGASEDKSYPISGIVRTPEEYAAFVGIDVLEARQRYDGNFFATKNLIIVYNLPGSSSVEYQVRKVILQENGTVRIEIDQDLPVIGNDDCMSWMTVIEVAALPSEVTMCNVEYTTYQWKAEQSFTTYPLIFADHGEVYLIGFMQDGQLLTPDQFRYDVQQLDGNGVSEKVVSLAWPAMDITSPITLSRGDYRFTINVTGMLVTTDPSTGKYLIKLETDKQIPYGTYFGTCSGITLVPDDVRYTYPSGVTYWSYVYADLDSDGDQDEIGELSELLSGVSGRVITVERNGQIYRIEDWGKEYEDWGLHIIPADIDKDGELELIVYENERNEADCSVYIYSFNGTGYVRKLAGTLKTNTPDKAIPPQPPADTNLEFWIGQNVADVNWSEYDEIYGWFGANEYLGKGYHAAQNDQE